MARKDFGDEMASSWLGEVLKKRNVVGRWNAKTKCVPGLFQEQFST